MSKVPAVVVLTGAGVSAESGLSTFRDADGIWKRHKIEDVATPEAFARDPVRVHDFYNMRRARLATVAPNAAHAALARFDAEWPGDLLIVTQNVDDLHERAGARRLVHMHGELRNSLCAHCGRRRPDCGDLSIALTCGDCGREGGLRPDVVWFGETPYHMERIAEALSRCALFVAIGTSGAVYPAGGFADEARRAGARAVELNLEPTDGVARFDEAHHGPASEIVPAWFDALLKAHAGATAG